MTTHDDIKGGNNHETTIHSRDAHFGPALGAVLLAPSVAWAAPAGDGSAASPYQIADADDLYWFAEQVNGGDVDACAVLTADITINENVLDENGALNG